MTRADGNENAAELLAELRRLAERFPLPQPIWHGFVPEMQEVIGDLSVALEVIAALPEAQAALVHAVESEADRPADEEGVGPTVAAARRRLRELPVPQGEHPFVDEIVVTLDAAEKALSALGVAGGEALFASALAQRAM